MGNTRRSMPTSLPHLFARVGEWWQGGEPKEVLAVVFLESKTLTQITSAHQGDERKRRGPKTKKEKKIGLRKAEMCFKDFSPSCWFLLHARSASKGARQRYMQYKTLACAKLPQTFADTWRQHRGRCCRITTHTHVHTQTFLRTCRHLAGLSPVNINGTSSAPGLLPSTTRL